MSQQQLITQFENNLKKTCGNTALKGIGPVKLGQLYSILKFLTLEQLQMIFDESHAFYMYYILFSLNINIDETVLNFLFNKYNKQNINHVINKLEDSNQDLLGLQKATLILYFKNLTKNNCQISNIFLQDLFQPDNIFKNRYTPFNFDIFSTSFYYLMNCQYKRQDFPLQVKYKSDGLFHFPFDVHLSEWNRPIILVDVQNVMRDDRNVDGRFELNGKHYYGAIFSERKKCILDERFYILERLFHKHYHPNTMVLFITQADTIASPNQTCLKITDLKKNASNETKNLLKGNGNNRVALYIEVPCTEFVYNTNNNIVRDYSIRDDITRYNTADVYRYWYDNYNRLYRFDENRGYYQKLTKNSPVPPGIIKNRNNRAGRLSANQTQQNKFLNYVKVNSNCSNGIRKNELDDYLIGLILLLHKKTIRECYKMIIDYIPIVFTADNYNWMRSSLKNTCFFESNFISYLKSNNNGFRNFELNDRNFNFWYGNNSNRNKIEIDVINISETLYRNLHSS